MLEARCSNICGCGMKRDYEINENNKKDEKRGNISSFSLFLFRNLSSFHNHKCLEHLASHFLFSINSASLCGCNRTETHKYRWPFSLAISIRSSISASFV